MAYKLTVGPLPLPDGRMVAVITEGGHPQFEGSGDCTVCTIALIDELPNGDADAWFKQQVIERPWETRQ